MPGLVSGRLALPPRNVRIGVGCAIWSAIACAMAAMALTLPVDHDESQYVAAAALASGGLPFGDFAHLQTPLQAWLFAPIAQLFAGHAFVALRIVTGLLGAAILGLVYAAQRLLHVEPRRAAISTALLACCYSFQFSCGVVRNDALPALLSAGSMLAAIAAARGGTGSRRAWALAGLLLGAAVSAKISYALPLAATGTFVLLEARGRRAPIGAVAALVAGAAVGLAPCLVAWLSAPENFVYGVFTYAMTAPFEWYERRGMSWRLDPGGKLLDLSLALVRGPALGALVAVSAAVGLQRWRSKTRAPREVALLDWLIVAGLAAAMLPTPVHPQYALPLLAPLFVRLGACAPTWNELPRGLKTAASALVAAGVLVGLVTYAYFLAAATRTGLPAVRLTRESHWIGERLRAAGADGIISTLAPHLAVDSGYPLDPRLATGAFLYRTGDALPEAELRRLNAMTPSTVVEFLDERPPAAILVGYEGHDDHSPIDLDAPFRSYARARGYRSERSPYGKAELYVRPSGAGAVRAPLD